MFTVSVLPYKDTDWWITFKKKIRPNSLLPARNVPHWQNQTQPKSKKMEKYILSKWKLKASWSSYTYIEQSWCQTKIIQKRQNHFILIKRKIHQKDIAIVDIYSSNTSASHFIKWVLLNIKAQVDPNTTVVGDYHILLIEVIQTKNSTKKHYS
jgi:hypothetical protein